MVWSSPNLQSASQLFGKFLELNGRNANEMQMMGQGQTTENIARSFTSMADMCRMMIEMKGPPLKMAALAIVGTLGTAALALF